MALTTRQWLAAVLAGIWALDRFGRWVLGRVRLRPVGSGYYPAEGT